ncbi:MAG: pitrilysin family protein [Candidatus Theseobacter exili]|nr:pitrilysin family protein [Candidatus Theseobacter exili]
MLTYYIVLRFFITFSMAFMLSHHLNISVSNASDLVENTRLISGKPDNTDLTQETLDNGMSVIVKNIPKSELITLMIYVGAGSTSEGSLMGSGLAHLAEHMIFQGAEHGSDSEMGRKIEGLGGEINAFTSYDHTAYYIVVPSASFSEALKIVTEPFLSLNFTDESFANEKGVVRKEINMRSDNPDVTIRKLLWSTAYRVHPYKHPLAGYVDLMDKLTPGDLQKFYDRNYVPENMAIVAVGAISESIRKEIKENFGRIKRRSFEPKTFIAEPIQTGQRYVKEQGHVSLTRSMLVFKAPSYNHPDAPALDVLAIVLGRGKSSRLYKKLKQEQQLVYSVSAWSHTPSGPGLWGISILSEDDKNETAIQESLNILESMKVDSITSEELKKAINRIESEHVFSLETVQGQALDLGTSWILTGNASYTEHYISEIKKVTRDDIKRVAGKYFKPEYMSIAVLSPEAAVKKRTEKKKDKNEELDIKKYVLNKGLTLLVAKDSARPIVSIRIVGLGGLMDETEKTNGVYNLMSSLLIKGTKEYTADDFADLIEIQGGKFSSYSANNSFGLSFDILNEHLNNTLNLASRMLSESIFAVEEIHKAKQQTLAAIRAREERPLQVGIMKLRKVLFENQPLGMDPLGTMQSVEDIDREDILVIHRKAVCQRNIVVSIMGDINVEKTLEMVRDHFDKLPEGKRISLIKKAFKPLPEKKEYIIRRNQSQAVILLGVRGPSFLEEDRYSMDLLAALFSGQASGVFDRLRDKLGAVYYVGGTNTFGLDAGYFMIFAGTVPGMMKDVQKGINSELERIVSEEIQPEEIKRVKNNLIGGFAREHQTLSSRAFEAALNELYGLGYSNFMHFEKRIRDLSPEKVHEASNKFLNKNNRVIVWVVPETQNNKDANIQKLSEKGINNDG